MNYSQPAFFRVLKGIAKMEGDIWMTKTVEVMNSIDDKWEYEAGTCLYVTDPRITIMLRERFRKDAVSGQGLSYILPFDCKSYTLGMFPYRTKNANNTKDFVLLYFGLHQVQIPMLALYEVFRIMVVGGRLLIFDFDLDTKDDLVWYHFWHKMTCMAKNCFLKSCSSLSVITSILEFVGFERIDIVARDAFSGFYTLSAYRGKDNDFARPLRDGDKNMHPHRVLEKLLGSRYCISEGFGHGWLEI